MRQKQLTPSHQGAHQRPGYARHMEGASEGGIRPFVSVSACRRRARVCRGRGVPSSRML